MSDEQKERDQYEWWDKEQTAILRDRLNAALKPRLEMRRIGEHYKLRVVDTAPESIAADQEGDVNFSHTCPIVCPE